MSNMYFFSNKTWGPCYTVMAESMKEAIKKVKEYVGNKNKNRNNTKYDFRKKEEEEKRIVGEITIESNDSKDEFEIKTYGQDEVIPTEYS